MTAPARLSALALLAIVAACAGGDGAAPAVDADLQRDLQLASTSSIALAPTTANLTQLETAPPAAEIEAPTPKRAPEGPRRVRSEQPTEAAEPVTEVAAGTDAGSAEVAPRPVALESEPAEEAATDVAVALPRPVPANIPVATTGTGNVGDGNVGTGRGTGGGGWGVWGVVMRGGGVGGVDDCEIHDRRNRGGGTIYRRPPSSSGGGGVATGRWPMGGDRGTRTAEAPRGGGSRGGRWPVGRN